MEPDICINFCVLPYVRVDRPFRFANYTIWPDRTDNWKKYLKCKRPKDLLDIYTDREGEQIESKTIISFNEQSESIKIPQLVAALFYPLANKPSFPPHAEDLYFEIYECRNPDCDSHTRVDKFWRSFVLSKGFKIFQSEYANHLKYELQGQNQSYFIKLRLFFNCLSKQNIIYSLYFFYRTQYRNDQLFPKNEDIQNYCTAFEILFKIDSRDTANELANALAQHFSQADQREKDELKAWLIKFYDLRSHYTHGKPIDESRHLYKSQRHIDIARKVYINAVNKFIRPGSPGRELFAFHKDRETLLALFSSQELCDDVVKVLTPHFGESNSGSNNCTTIIGYPDNKLAEMDKILSSFRLYANKDLVEYSSSCKKLRLKEAMQTILSQVEYLMIKYADDKEERKVSYTEALEPLKKMNFLPKTNQEFEAFENDFNTRWLNCSEPIVDFEDLSKHRFEVRLNHVLEISGLMALYVELSRIYNRIIRTDTSS